MSDRDAVLRDLSDLSTYLYIAGIGPNRKIFDGWCQAVKDARELIREQEPRVMTLEEVIKHYSLPLVFVDDLGAQEDYLQDIAPLYFDFPVADSWAVHWRGYQSVRRYLDDWKASYGIKWRCWTARPTDEQREAVKWDADAAD